MKIFLKEVVYFEISIPDGQDRSLVTSEFRKHFKPEFRSLLKNIVIEESDKEFLHKLCGNVDIRIVFEDEVLKLANSPKPDSQMV